MTRTSTAVSTPPTAGISGNAAGLPTWLPTLAGGVTIVSLIAFFWLVMYLLPRADGLAEQFPRPAREGVPAADET